MFDARWLKAACGGSAVLITLGGAGSVAKESVRQDSAPVLQSVIRCRGIVEDAARLACFDTAVAALDKAQGSGDLVAVDREQRRAVRRQTFGFTLPSLSIFDRGDRSEDTDRLAVVIASAARDGVGRWTVVLDDGAVWRQTDDSVVEPPPRHGSKAVIRKGTLGSFFMTVDGRGSMKVRRDR